MNWTLTLTGYDANELKALIAAIPAGEAARMVTHYDDSAAEDEIEVDPYAIRAPDTKAAAPAALLKGEGMFGTRTTFEIAKASVDAIYSETKTVGCANGAKLTEGDTVKVGGASTALVAATYKKAVIVVFEEGGAMVLRPEGLVKVETASGLQAPLEAEAEAEEVAEDALAAEDEVTMDTLRVLGGTLLDLVGATAMVAILKQSAGVAKLRDISDAKTLHAAYHGFKAAVEKAAA